MFCFFHNRDVLEKPGSKQKETREIEKPAKTTITIDKPVKSAITIEDLTSGKVLNVDDTYIITTAIRGSLFWRIDIH